MLMSETYGYEFCMEHLSLFEIDRINHINIMMKIDSLKEFNDKNDSCVTSTIELKNYSGEENYYVNDEKTKDIKFKLDSVVNITDSSAFFTFKNEETNLVYRHLYGDTNKVFLHLP